MSEKLRTEEWEALSPAIQEKLRWFFAFKDEQDLEAITLEKLRKFNDVEEGEFEDLWARVVRTMERMQRKLDESPVMAMLKEINANKEQNV